MPYHLKLFIAGDSDLSRRAIANLQRICGERLRGNCQTEVIDVLVAPEQARAYRVIATPVAVRVDVAPHLKVLGDLSDEGRLMSVLNMHPAAT